MNDSFLDEATLFETADSESGQRPAAGSSIASLIAQLPKGDARDLLVKLDQENQTLQKQLADQHWTFRALMHRSKMEQALVEFADALADPQKTAPEQLLEIIARPLGAGRCYLVQLDQKHTTIDSFHQWYAARIIENRLSDLDLNRQALDWLVPRLQTGQDIFLSDLKELPTDVRWRTQALKDRGVHSLLIAPAFDQGSLQGFIGIEIDNQDQEWSDADCRLIRLAARMLIGDLKRQGLSEDSKCYQSLFYNSLDCIAIFDVKGNFLDANKQTQNLFGLDLTQLKKIKTNQLVAPQSLKSINKALQELDDEGFSRLEVDLQGPDGRIVPIEASATWLYTKKERIIQAILRDITQRKQAQRKQEKLSAQLRQSQKLEAIGTLAGGIAHDFNNMLVPIIGYSEMTKFQLEEDNPLQENLTQIMKAAQRAKDLVAQILAFSRQKDGEVKSLRLDPVVKESLKLLRSSLPTTIEIETRIEPGAKFILANPSQIQQILTNLCVNASHAMPDGGRLTVSLAEVELIDEVVPDIEHPVNGRFIELCVADTGFGMTEETLANIFDPYFTTKSLDMSSGLGLAVVHGNVVKSGGHIIVSSKPGQGATFRVRFPAVDQEIKNPAGKQAKSSVMGDEHILLVDDDQMVIKVTVRILENQGYRVTAKNDSNHALDLFNSRPDDFDLVITDLIMPRLNGKQLAKRIHQIRPDQPIILSTGYSNEFTPEQIKQAGISDIIVKPILGTLLCDKVRQALDNSKKTSLVQ